MASLTVSPNPATPSSVVAVAGSGFPNAKTRLALDGQGISTNIFRPRKDGTFHVGITVSSTPRTQTLVAQQQSGKTWSEAARTTVVVQASPSPPPPPPPTPPPPSFGTIQAALDAAVSGATILVPGGTYREALVFRKPVRLVSEVGAVIDGRDVNGNIVRDSWGYVTADDVTIKGFRMQYASSPYSQGALQNVFGGVKRLTVEDCDLSYALVLVNLGGTTDATLRNCALHDAMHLGARIAGYSESQRGVRTTVEDCRLFHNDRTGYPDPQADGGNLKATFQDDLRVSGTESSDSGKGLWLDVHCRNAVLTRNRVHHNDTCGIHDETSTGTHITENAVWKNGYGPWGTWGWGAGILVAACKDADVYRNTVAWNRTGISFISQQRGDDPGMTGNFSHENVVAMEQPTAGNDRFGEFWAQDWAGGLYLPASNNRGLNDRFWYPAPENQYSRFIWDGYRTMASYQAVPGGTGAAYMTTAVKDAALAAAGIPLNP